MGIVGSPIKLSNLYDNFLHRKVVLFFSVIHRSPTLSDNLVCTFSTFLSLPFSLPFSHPAVFITYTGKLIGLITVFDAILTSRAKLVQITVFVCKILGKSFFVSPSLKDVAGLESLSITFLIPYAFVYNLSREARQFAGKHVDKKTYIDKCMGS